MFAFAATVRHAVRRWRRQPLVALAGVVTLAVGLGSAAVVLAYVEAAVVRPVAFAQPERLVDVLATRGRGASDRFALYPADLVAWRRASSAFESLAGYSPLGALTSSGDGEPERFTAHRVTPDYFATLGIEPLVGGDLRAEDAVSGAPPVLLMSHSLWQRRFAADPGILGRTLLLDGEPYSVRGVMPPGFGTRGGSPELWLPLVLGVSAAEERRSAYMGAIGRLAPGSSLAAARAELEAVADRIARQHPRTHRGLRPSLLPLTEVMVAGQRDTVRWLLAVAALLLTVAVVNGVALALVQAQARRIETTLRLALGAGHGRLAAAGWLEDLPVVALGSACSLGVAVTALALLPDLGGRLLYRSVEPRLSGWVLTATASIALGVWALRGGVAWWAARRRSGTPSLGSLRAGRHQRTPRSLGVLMAAQVAAAAVLLAGAGLLLRSFEHLRSTELGFEPGGALLLELDLPAVRYPEGGEQDRLLADLLPRLAALPGIAAVGASTDPPGTGWGLQLSTAGGGESVGDDLAADFQAITPGWIGAAGLPLLAGRDLSPVDRRETPPVALLSEKAAGALFPAGGATGRRIWIDSGNFFEVVGVVGEARRDPLVPVRPMVYLAHPQMVDELVDSGRRWLSILLRASAGEPSAASNQLAAVRTVLAEIDPALAPASLTTLETRLSDALLRPRVTLRASLFFALAALVLAAVGLYGTLSFEVGLRRREIGLRMALGSSRGQVVLRVLRRGLVLVVAGSALGLGLAVLGGRLLSGLLHGVVPLDPPTLAGVLLLLSLSALAVACLPARRAAAADPAECLRAD